MGTIVHIDSFDHYTTVADKGWIGTGGFGVTGARNGNGLYAQGSWSGGYDGAVRRVWSGSARAIVGFALRSARRLAENIYFAEDAVANHLYLAWAGSGALELRHGDNTLLGTTSSAWTGSNDKYVEVDILIANSGGHARVYVNGVLEINFSGDTQNGGSALVNQLNLVSGQITFEGAHNLIIDDLYIIDNADAASTPLGDCKVECDFPSGNGNSSQLDGSDGNSTDNYLLVDEAANDGDTTYVESATVDEKDTYAFGDLASATGVVHAVQINAFAKKTDSGARGLKTVARLSGTEVDSSSTSLGTSYAAARDIRTTKPGGGSWTIADVNNAEFGVKVAA